MKTVSHRKSAVKVSPATEQIVIPVTKEQRQMIEARCKQFRITPPELAANMLFGVLNHPSEDELWLTVVKEAAEAERAGVHPLWEACQEELKKLIAS